MRRWKLPTAPLPCGCSAHCCAGAVCTQKRLRCTHIKNRAVAQSGARTALQKGGAKQRAGTGIDGPNGIDKNWLSFSVRGHSNRTNRSSSIRDRSDSSNCRSSIPGARNRVRASILPGHAKTSSFVLHPLSDCCFDHPSISGEAKECFNLNSDFERIFLRTPYWRVVQVQICSFL